MSDENLPLQIVNIVDHASITGGQAKVAFDSAIGLKHAGYNPIIFAAAGPIEPKLLKEGIEVICLDQNDLIGNPSRAAAAVQGIWNYKAARELKALLARLPKGRTIVHVHGWAKALSPSIAGAIASSGHPALYTVHEYFLFCPNGGFYNYQTRQACKLEPLSTQCLATHCDSINYPRKLWRSLRQVVMKDIAHLPEVFSDYIMISRFQIGVVSQQLPKGVNIHQISNPIEVEQLGRKENPASGDVIFVGRISPEKGPFLFAEAARKIGMIPVYVGDGPAAAELKQRYPEAKVMGWKTPTEVRALMRQARALVFPSLWYEGQPLTVLEAKALGTPVIVADGCAGREEIEHFATGLWFRGADVDALAAMLMQAQNDELIKKLSDGAYDSYWADPPSIQKHVAAITQVYGDMLDKAKSGVAMAS